MTIETAARKIEIKEIKVFSSLYGKGFLEFQIIVDGDEKGAALFRSAYDSLKLLRRGRKNGENLPASACWWGISIVDTLDDYYRFAVYDVPAKDAAKFYIWLHSCGGVTVFPKE